MEIIKLETAKKLANIGWSKYQTEKGYLKQPHCTVYDIVVGQRKMRSYDAPTEKELLKICDAIDYIIEDSLPIETLAENLIQYCRRHKIKLSQFSIN